MKSLFRVSRRVFLSTLVEKQAESFEEYGVVIHQKDSDGHGDIPWFQVHGITGLGNKIFFNLKPF